MNGSDTLSIIIPCYNERATLQRCVARVLEIERTDLEIEIVIVDDCSTDDSLSIAELLATKHQQVRVVSHPVNMGKGAAIRTGFARASGEYIAIQDADLEYDPQDLVKLISPLMAGKADAVIGSRFLSAGVHRVLYFWHAVGNKFL